MSLVTNFTIPKGERVGVAWTNTKECNMIYLNAADYGASPAAAPSQNTTAIRAAFSDLANQNKSVVYIPAGTYMVETDIYHGKTIDLFDNHELLLDRGCVLIGSLRPNATSHSHPLIFVRGNHCRVSGGKLVGTMATNHYGILVNEETEGTVVENCIIENFGGDGVVGRCNKLSLNNLTIRTIGRNCISVTRGQKIVIEKCELGNAGVLDEPGAGIDIEPNIGDSVCNIEIVRNTVSGCRIGIYAQLGQGETRAISVTNNVVTGCGIAITGIDGVFVNENKVGEGAFLKVHSCTNVRVDQSSCRQIEVV